MIKLKIMPTQPSENNIGSGQLITMETIGEIKRK